MTFIPLSVRLFRMEEKVFISGSDGLKLCGILSQNEKEKRSGAVVLCHGFATSKDSRTFIELENRLLRGGLAVLRFDFFGHGESDGCFEEITVGKAIDNVKTAWTFMQKKGFLPLGLVGSSFGGLAAASAAPDLPGLCALALKSPVTGSLVDLMMQRNKRDADRWKRDGFILLPFEEGESLRLNYTFYEDEKSRSAVGRAEEINCQVLIVQGDRDESVPPEQSRLFFNRLRQGRLHMIKGADHRYSEPRHFSEMIDVLDEFLLKTIKMDDRR